MTTTQQSEAPERAFLEFTLGDRLGRSLRHAGLGVSEMAQILGVGRETISRWINDHNPPKRAALLAWAAITNVSIDWLETGQAPAVMPEPEELRARRDSNPKPSDLYLVTGSGPSESDNPRLSANRRTHNPPTLRLVEAS